MMLKYLLILALITGGIPVPASADNGNIPVDLQAKATSARGFCAIRLLFVEFLWVKLLERFFH